MSSFKKLINGGNRSSSHSKTGISPAVGDRGSSLRRESDAPRGMFSEKPEKRFPGLMPQTSMEQVPEGLSKRSLLPAIIVGGFAFVALFFLI